MGACPRVRLRLGERDDAANKSWKHPLLEAVEERVKNDFTLTKTNLQFGVD